MKKLLVMFAALLLPAMASAVGICEKQPDCKGEQCGCVLMQQSWKMAASCHDGHSWSYVLEKGGKQLVCQGMNARGGPQESPCTPFTGDVKAFRAAGEKAQVRREGYAKAVAASTAGGKLDFEQMRKRQQALPDVNCLSLVVPAPQEGKR